MTSPAKSCSILLCALLLMAAGCNDKNVPQSLNGNVARPTWTAIEESDMTSSMTAVVKVDLAALYPDKASDFVMKDKDMLAAFIGDNCCGIAKPQDGLFFLYIAAPTANANANTVTLRYYSAHYKNLFVDADAFPFVNDAHLGTVAEPLTPNFAVVK